MNRLQEEKKRKKLGFLIGFPLMLIFLVGGAVGTFKGASGLWLEHELQHRGVATGGEVIHSMERNTGPGQPQQKRNWREVTYQFSTETDTRQRTVDIEMHQNPPRTGDEIVIHYLPENPDRNWPLEFRRGWWNWFIAGFGALVAVFSAVIVVGMLVVRIRELIGTR